MIEFLLGFYAKSASIAPRDPDDPNVQRELRRRRWLAFLAITFGYGFYYVCRLSFSVAKKSMADAGVFDAAELGLIGSALFFAYAFGKLTNGIIADRVNTRRFMATGLFVSAVVNYSLGFSPAFTLFLCCGVSAAGFSHSARLRVSSQSRIGTTESTAARSTACGPAVTISVRRLRSLEPQSS